MQDFIKHFVREHDGAWTCVSPAELETDKGRVRVTPGARFTPGTVFMDIDLVEMLEDERVRDQHRPAWIGLVFRHQRRN